jgi:hypothetical protein
MNWSPAVLAAIATAALIAARLMAISRFDVNTAAMILQVSGTGTALAGTALTLLAPAIAGATLFIAVVVFIDPTLVRAGLPNEWLLSLAIAATICLTPLPLAVGVLVLVAVVGAAGWLLRRNGTPVSLKDQLKDSRLLRMLFTILVVLAAVAPLVLQRPWLPLQQITLANDAVVVGYVLGEAEGQVVVMNDTDRTITLLQPDDIREREICQGGAQPGGAMSGVPQVSLSGSALGLLLWGDDTPSYPSCPTTN